MIIPMQERSTDSGRKSPLMFLLHLNALQTEGKFMHIHLSIPLPKLEKSKSTAAANKTNKMCGKI